MIFSKETLLAVVKRAIADGKIQVMKLSNTALIIDGERACSIDIGELAKKVRKTGNTWGLAEKITDEICGIEAVDQEVYFRALGFRKYFVPVVYEMRGDVPVWDVTSAGVKEVAEKNLHLIELPTDARCVDGSLRIGNEYYVSDEDGRLL